MHIDPNSLSKTVDSVNESTFFALRSTSGDRLDVARWIASRQGLPGSYGEMFAGLDGECASVQLFTGERITSASARHILGEEACRALRLLKVRDKAVQEALRRADAGMMKCLNACQRDGRSIGWFCCGKCSVGVWRNVLSGGLDRREERLANGIRVLRDHRDGKAGWERFPFWYTVLALIEINDSAAADELKQVGAKLERASKVKAPGDCFAARRKEIAARALARI